MSTKSSRTMSKNKLAKFADMATYPNVFQSADIHPADWEQDMRGHWAERVFHNDNPIVLELGCGRGEYCVGLGRLFPQKNFIGVDIKGSRMWHGATEALETGMTNVAFLRTHIEFIERFFAPGEISEIWLTFSDPQMKKATKRLTSTFFMQRYRHFLTDGGLVHVKTDSNFLFTYTREMVTANHLPAQYMVDDLYGQVKDDPILSIQTYYEQQWLSRGLTIKYLRFQLPAATPLVEPEVDIPLDEYRSYNRQKRSSLETSR